MVGFDVVEEAVVVVVFSTPQPDSPGNEALAQSKVVVECVEEEDVLVVEDDEEEVEEEVVEVVDEVDVLVTILIPHPDSPGNEAFAQSKVVVVVGRVVVDEVGCGAGNEDSASRLTRKMRPKRNRRMSLSWRVPHPLSPGKLAEAQSKLVVVLRRGGVGDLRIGSSKREAQAGSSDGGGEESSLGHCWFW